MLAFIDFLLSKSADIQMWYKERKKNPGVTESQNCRVTEFFPDMKKNLDY